LERKPTTLRKASAQVTQVFGTHSRTRGRADRDLQSICPDGAGFGTHIGWQPRFHALAALADSCKVPGPASDGFLTATRESR
jgi:hypothetical protein